METYKGGCHCKAVRYEAQMELTKVMTCNCSHCSMKGFVLTFIPATQFTLLSGEDQLTEYRFNKNVIQHLFCRVCGVQSFGRGKGPGGIETAMINARCLDDFDYSKLPTTEYPGKDI